jgi:7-carboxy-7-deazaguanine synthase
VKLPAVVDRGSALAVNEIFGPTFQGEGPLAGQAAMFVRLFGCPLSCAWCDTGWTWDATRFDLGAEQHPMPVEVVLNHLRAHQTGLVVVTGGEPLLQQDGLIALAAGIHADKAVRQVQVETSGTIAPRPALSAVITLYCVSPKLSNSGLRRHQRIRPGVLRDFAATGKASFKFVVCDPADLDEISEITAECALEPVWVMPEGRDSATILARMRELAGPVAARGWNLTPRLQVLLWEDGRAH